MTSLFNHNAHTHTQGTLGLELMRAWDAHASALAAADAATEFGHPSVKVRSIDVTAYAAAPTEGLPPCLCVLPSNHTAHTIKQACHLHERALTRTTAAVVAVGQGHALVGVLRRLSKARGSPCAKARACPLDG